MFNALLITLIASSLGVVLYKFLTGGIFVVKFAIFSVLIGLLLNSISYFSCVFAQTAHSEIWNFPIAEVHYYEPWEEVVTKKTTDDKGNTTTMTYYVHHSAEWKAVTDNGTNHDIKQSEFEHWKNQWGNVTEEDVFHFDQSLGSKFRGEGDKWVSEWNREFNTMFPFSSVHRYTNKLRATNTVWNFKQVDKETKEKFRRPADMQHLSPVLSYGVGYHEKDELFLKRLNASLGPRYQVHNIIVLLPANEYDSSVVETILGAWQGPNKNELVVLMGVDQYEVKWCQVVSWMDDTTIHSLIRQQIMNSGVELNLVNVGNVVRDNIEKHWHRKEFADFDYVDVKTPFHLNLIYLALSVGSCVGAFFLVENMRH